MPDYTREGLKKVGTDWMERVWKRASIVEGNPEGGSVTEVLGTRLAVASRIVAGRYQFP